VASSNWLSEGEEAVSWPPSHCYDEALPNRQVNVIGSILRACEVLKRFERPGAAFSYIREQRARKSGRKR